jgi:hypothetical protein
MVSVFAVGRVKTPTRQPREGHPRSGSTCSLLANTCPSFRHGHPDEFAEYKVLGEALGFRHVEAGSLARSSSHAFDQGRIRKKLDIQNDAFKKIGGQRRASILG